MRILTMALLLNAISVCPATLAAQKYGPAPDAATRKEVMAVREAAWRTWFSNDTAGFDRVDARTAPLWLLRRSSPAGVACLRAERQWPACGTHR